MILLDTNVISEPLRPSPEARVSDWIDAQPLETLYLSAMTVAGLRAGVALMPTGKRRTALHEHLQKRGLPIFAGQASASRLPMPASQRSILPTDLPLLHATQALSKLPAWTLSTLGRTHKARGTP